MKGSEAFAETIEQLGIEQVFGNPGTTEIAMLRHVKNYVLALHDSISLGMADGLAQASGKPTLCNLHTTLGLGNSMAFLHTAMTNRSPVIVTAGQQDYRHMFYEPLLSGDLVSMAERFSKYSYEIKNVEDIERSLRRAYEIALDPPFGPVFLSFPDNFMDEEVEIENNSMKKNSSVLVDEQVVKEIAHKINDSSNPAIVFGFEIDIFGAHEQAVKFVEKIGCPAYSEPLASRSPFPSESRAYAGDLSPASALINMKLLQHDLVVVVGGELKLYPYTPAPLLPGKEVIFVGSSVSAKTGVSYKMNPKAFLEHALKLVTAKSKFERKGDPLEKSKAVLEKKNMGPNYIFSKLKKHFLDHVIVDESISMTPDLRKIMGYRSGSYFTARTGQLGWALPAAAGISFARDKVLCVIGDGSFMYTPQTLWTIKKHHLPVKLIILDNGGYVILRSFSKSYYQDMENTEFLQPHIELEKMVSAFGIDYRVADADLTDLEWLRETLDPKVLIIRASRNVPKLFI